MSNLIQTPESAREQALEFFLVREGVLAGTKEYDLAVKAFNSGWIQSKEHTLIVLDLIVENEEIKNGTKQ